MDVSLIVIIGVLGSVLLIGLISLACYCLVCRPKRKSKTEKYSGLQKNKQKTDKDGEEKARSYVNVPIPTPDRGKASYVNEAVIKESKSKYNIKDVLGKVAAQSVESYVIDEKRLKVDKVIGKGQFGLVCKGFLTDKNLKKSKQVAVKTVSSEKCDESDVSEFMAEAMRMRGYQHPNVLSLIGLVLKDNVPYVVLPFMDHGDLLSFISNPKNELTVFQLLEFAVQIADGMAYLVGQGFVHRDLAARNCMLDATRTVKVADFGLSRDIHDDDYYLLGDLNTPLPVRWMAVECLDTFKFTAQSDVWSYGILLWELYTRGEKPYPMFDNAQVIRYVRKGERLKTPDYAPKVVYEMMQHCWRADPEERPTFGQISRNLKVILASVKDEASSATLQRQYLHVIEPVYENKK